MDDIFVPPSPKPNDRQATKPIYIVLTEDRTFKEGICYYKAENIDRQVSHVNIRGSVITEAQFKSLGKNLNAKIAKTELVNIEVPWQRVIRIENLTYKIAKRTE